MAEIAEEAFFEICSLLRDSSVIEGGTGGHDLSGMLRM